MSDLTHLHLKLWFLSFILLYDDGQVSRICVMYFPDRLLSLADWLVP